MWFGRIGGVCGLDGWVVYVVWTDSQCVWFGRIGGVCGLDG